MDFILPDYSWTDAKKLDCPFDYILKMTHFANSSTDLLVTRIKRTVTDMRQGGISFGPKLLTEAEREEKRLENVVRSVRRAKQQVHYSVRSCGADHMLTLTTRDCISDRVEFFTIFNRFIRLVRSRDLVVEGGKKFLIARAENRHYDYVAVPELQERGAFHMHVACCGKQDLNLLRACWYRALGADINARDSDAPGQINVQYRKKRFGNTSEIYKTMQLVSYMVKYISKSFEVTQDLGLNRYSKAHHIPKPKVLKQYLYSSFFNNGADYVRVIQEVYSIAEFLGFRDMVPWNKAGNEDFFLLRGVEA